jgi:beta-glucosidase
MKVFLAAIAACCAPLAMASSLRHPVYKDAAAPIEDRVADLLAKMTLQEKVNQVSLTVDV